MHCSPGGLFMPQFDERATEFLDDRALIAHAGQKVLDVVEQGTMKGRFEETVAFCRVDVNLVRRARTRLHAGLKILEVRLHDLQSMIEIQTATPDTAYARRLSVTRKQSGAEQEIAQRYDRESSDIFNPPAIDSGERFYELSVDALRRMPRAPLRVAPIPARK